ncbi:TetR family transcriptional regulator [Solihabitans fulvus]|uniref:TetR family transcriptional regulator n=1 Tax=Solihabitans fulvus TaxID=1892852 RepID=A0A5B2X625_9PSEU|nr:TetR family transcriptional regulator [Solihabitans fulvus]KAA2258670.1 TetR family transcriptional regulator [Solihabitans fulvus]
MAEKSAGQRRRTRSDWAAAALRALAEGGVAAVAVEPVAASLGATKGSVYWHFPNREALLTAALELWETEHTEAVIELLEPIAEPLAKLRTLFSAVLEDTDNRVLLALLASAEDPVVAPVLGRVTERRIGYLATLFGELGWTPTQSRRRAVLAYAAYVGQAQLMRSSPKMLPANKVGRRAYLDDALHALGVPPASKG